MVKVFYFHKPIFINLSLELLIMLMSTIKSLVQSKESKELKIGIGLTNNKDLLFKISTKQKEFIKVKKKSNKNST